MGGIADVSAISVVPLIKTMAEIGEKDDDDETQSRHSNGSGFDCLDESQTFALSLKNDVIMPPID